MTSDREARRDKEFVDRRPLTEEEVYNVAKMLCETGLSANGIAARLYKDEYEGKAGKAQTIMRVKHLIARALKTGIISLRYAREDLKRQLEADCRGVKFTVVEDIVRGGEPVYQEAARLVAQAIDDLMRQDRPVVIANAGGLALSRMTEYLPAVARLYRGAADRLLFISLNALRRADSYHLSSNFVAVRMASIFGGRHLAMLKAQSTEAEIERALDAVDLLVCGAGSPAGFLPEWLQDEDSRSRAGGLPPEVVGDICLIPLDRIGRPVGLKPSTERRIQTELSPRPSYEALRKLADQDKVLVVLAVPVNDNNEVEVELKIPIAEAILKPPLTKRCVLGSSLASALHQSIKSNGQSIDTATAAPKTRRGPRLMRKGTGRVRR